MFGWMGKILKVDLTAKIIEDYEIPGSWWEEYLGGRGLGVKLYSQLCSSTIDPLSAENALIFLTGPLTGTVFTSGRYQVISRSPLTGTICDSSSGGSFGAILKRTGIDGLIITGRSDKPVYLEITESGIEIKDAGKLWGLNTQQTRDQLVASLNPRASVASIGPAGENLVPFAAIMNDKDRAAGRGGMGAIMGAKNLKALAAFGTKMTEVHDKVKLKELNVKLDRLIDKNPVTGKSLPLLGTSVLVNIVNAHGMYPTENFKRGVFNDAEGTSGEKIAENLLKSKSACFRCPMACGRTTATSRKSGEGPEYETVWSFGAHLGINDLEAIAEANYACNELGLDTITAGSTIGCAMELVEKGALDWELNWGDANKIVDLVSDIAYKKGWGEDLALGSKKLAEKYGRPELAMQVKGMEIPAYDPRGVQGQALSYATSNRGGCHMRAYMISTEILGEPVFMDRFSTAGKAEIVALFQDICAVVDSLILCRFVQFAFGVGTFCEMLEYVTGIKYTEEDLLKVGKRIYTLERVYNNKAGFTKADDTLPPRFLQEELEEGASRNRVVQLAEMLKDYYVVRGWTTEGIPTVALKKELGL
jgi:aldehyde:ferredoxin oxidoreductase